jgi:CCR4-NOT transcription complex subunit 6
VIVPAPPLLDRAMIDIIDESSLSSSQESIRVFSHNTLCEKYATEQQYGYTPSLALAWPTRKQKILDNIQQIDADIVCLQEVDSHNFNEYFCQELAYGDYKGVFWPKSRAKTMNENDAKAVDGCATFYKGSKYILLDKQLIGFSELAINRPDMKNQHDIFNRVMPRDDIATICFFENRQTGSRFIVVNAHIYWNPVYSDVKIIQTAILLESLTKQAAKYARWPACKDKKTYALSDENEIPSDIPPPKMMPSMEYSGGTQIPLIICSDLNSRFDSGVCDLLALGSLKGDHPDMGKHQYGNFTRDGMQHPFSLKSAYMSLKNDQNDLPFTNYTPAFIGVIDYIWYSSNCLEVTKLLGPIDSEYLKRVPGFPHYHFPSDHIQLVAEFIVKPSANVKKVSEVNFGPQRDRR